MPTATFTDAVPTDLKTAHRLAVERKREAHAVADTDSRALHALVRTVDPPDDQPTSDAVARLEAQLGIPAAKEKARLSQLEALRADAAEDAARTAVRDADAAARQQEVGAIHRELLPLLLKARPLADRLGQLKDADPGLDVYTWDALKSSGAHGGLFQFESTLDSVIRHARRSGWLDE